jgi:hypothetical protein
MATIRSAAAIGGHRCQDDGFRSEGDGTKRKHGSRTRANQSGASMSSTRVHCACRLLCKRWAGG